MAARTLKTRNQDGKPRFYVYEIFSEDVVYYVGKGSGRRLSAQKRNFGMSGRIVKWFFDEEEAYSFEIEHIAAMKPMYNKHCGGNGSRVVRKRVYKDKFARLCDKFGTRVVAARLALNFPWLLDKENINKLRVVAYG